MVNRLVSVGDDFTLPAAVKAVDANLPTRLGATALNATYAPTSGPKAYTPKVPTYVTQNNGFRQIPVVMFHQFTDTAAATGVLKDYLAWGYTPIFYSEMMAYLKTGDGSSLPAKPIVFTDDDGGASVYTALFPAMQALNVKMTCFLVPDWLDGTISAPANGGAFGEATAMTWAQAVTMQASGLTEFHAHTKAHGSMRALTGPGTFTADLSDDGTGAGADYLYCKNRIETMIPGSNVRYNAAPYGVINQAAIDSLKAAGCEGNRITETGKSILGIYDGSGPTAFSTYGTDPFAVPIADGGSFKNIKRVNVYGLADVDGNRVQNGLFTQTSRGWTLPTGWAFNTVTLPIGANPATGPVLRGFGTGAAVGAYHTEAIPVGFFAAFTAEFYLKTTSAPAGSVKMFLDTYLNPGDATPVSSLQMPSPTGGTTSWTPKRWYVLGDQTYSWVKLRFECTGATASTEVLVWDVKLRGQRSAWAQ